MLEFVIEGTRDRLLKKTREQTAPVITSVLEGDLAVLSLCGKIDFSSTALLRARVEDLSVSGVRRLVLSMPAVTGMDSVGLGQIIAISNRFCGEGREICLAGLSDRVNLLFEYAKLHFVFKIFPKVSDATGYLRNVGTDYSFTGFPSNWHRPI